MFPIVTNRTRISPLGLEDLEAFVAYRRVPEVARFQSWETDYSALQGRKLIESQDGMTMPLEDGWLQLAIQDIESGNLLGDLALHALRRKNSFEIGFTIAPRYQRHGYASEAASALLERLLRQHGATSVIANTDSRNVASIRTLEALGFSAVAEKTWTEWFKGENVTVLHYERAS
ncbi:MAG: GNAT family N-acetyltransferase [Aquiluna sp.]